MEWNMIGRRFILYIMIVFCSSEIMAQNFQSSGNEQEDRGLKEHNTAKFFDGFYLGSGVGTQNVFGGALVNNVDVLTQKSRGVFEIYSGFRRQLFRNRFVAGIEFQYGFTDGNLSYTDPANQLEIRYKNSSQWAVGLNMGVTFGEKKGIMVFLYGNETTRKFNVTIVDRFGTYKQEDEQGMLKYGIGVETYIRNRIMLRGTVGSRRVDFGNQQTNINVEGKLDLMLGAIYQF